MSTPVGPQVSSGDGPVPGWVLRLALGAFWVAAVGLITLTPGGERSRVELIPSLCLFCGTRGVADAVLNVVMFLPVGMILGARRGVGTAMAAGLVVSAGIETAQLFLAGRNPAVGDLVWNGMGAGMGAFVTRTLRGWMGDRSGGHRPPPFSARVVALGLGALYLGLVGLLLVPRGTEVRYFGQWTADLGHLVPYQGELLEATLDGLPVPTGPYAAGEGPRRALEGDFTLDARMVKGPPPSGISPVVSIYDALQREILLLGVHGEDLVFRERTWAQASGLDLHDVRMPDVLGPHAVGDTVTLAVRRVDGALCLRVDDVMGCGLGVTPGRTWGLLMNLEGAPPWFRTLLDGVWMATLFVLVGVLGGGARTTFQAACIAGMLVILVVAATPLVAGGWVEWVGLAVGIAAGVTARPLVRAFVASPGDAP